MALEQGGAERLGDSGGKSHYLYGKITMGLLPFLGQGACTPAIAGAFNRGRALLDLATEAIGSLR